MPQPSRTVSPGVSRLIPKELQDILWSLHEANPLLPSIFELRKGRGTYIQSIRQICLIPYFNQIFSVELSPLHDIRVTILQTDTGLLMRLSNKKLEAELSRQLGESKQGELF